MHRVLLVEDDTRLTGHLSKLLRTEGMSVHSIQSDEELGSTLQSTAVFDTVILDRLLGPTDTKVRISEIKRKWPSAAILVLSAINTPLERADVLNLGVDDYLGKPVLSKELVARINAVHRRSAKPNFRQVGNLIFDMARRTISMDEREESLPAKEFLLFRALTDESGKVLSRNDLLDTVWGGNVFPDTNVVEATITNLRRRLDGLGSAVQIRNVRNAGYWLES